MAYKTGRFKCIDGIGCFPIILLLHAFFYAVFFWCKCVCAYVVLPPFVDKWYHRILLDCWRVFDVYIHVCSMLQIEWNWKKRNKNCTNVAATTHKSFHIINIIKVIVTTLSVWNCLFCRSNSHTCRFARVWVCACVYMFSIVSPYNSDSAQIELIINISESPTFN